MKNNHFADTNSDWTVTYTTENCICLCIVKQVTKQNRETSYSAFPDQEETEEIDPDINAIDLITDMTTKQQ